MKSKNQIISLHEPVRGVIEIHRSPKHYMPKGFEYIIVFQKAIKAVLTHKLTAIEMKVFMFILSEVGFDNNLVMPGLQELCAREIGTYQPHISKALKKLSSMNVIIKEPLPGTKSFKYRINYALTAKAKGENVKERHSLDVNTKPIPCLDC